MTMPQDPQWASSPPPPPPPPPPMPQMPPTPAWTPASSVPPVGSLPGAGYVPPTPTLAEASSKKLAAGLCGILLGQLGIHKFILGYNSAGIIMLLVSLLTCGVGGIVMTVIGIIEGIMYLTKSDAEFYERYMVGRKEWF